MGSREDPLFAHGLAAWVALADGDGEDLEDFPEDPSSVLGGMVGADMTDLASALLVLLALMHSSVELQSTMTARASRSLCR